VGAGKSALAASIALESGFPYIKVIGPEQMVGAAAAMRPAGAASHIAHCCQPRLHARIAWNVAISHVTRTFFSLQVGYMEQAKGSTITKMFEDAYKSPLSIVILVSECHVHQALQLTCHVA